MFSEKLEIENYEVRTTPLREVIANFILINNKSGDVKIKKVNKIVYLSSVAPLYDESCNYFRFL